MFLEEIVQFLSLYIFQSCLKIIKSKGKNLIILQILQQRPQELNSKLQLDNQKLLNKYLIFDLAEASSSRAGRAEDNKLVKF